MPSGANDFLRRHPEIVEAFFEILNRRTSNTEAQVRTTADYALAAVLPAIFAAHEADLMLCAGVRTGHEDMDSLLAAAYLAGRLAGREEAAKHLQEQVHHAHTNEWNACLKSSVTAIRKLQ